MENWEKELNEKCISEYPDGKRLFKDPVLKELYFDTIRYYERDSLLKQFSEDAIDKLYRSPLFYHVFRYLESGSNRYEIIEKLIDIIENQQKVIEKLDKERTYSTLIVDGIKYIKK